MTIKNMHTNKKESLCHAIKMLLKEEEMELGDAYDELYTRGYANTLLRQAMNYIKDHDCSLLVGKTS